MTRIITDVTERIPADSARSATIRSVSAVIRVPDPAQALSRQPIYSCTTAVAPWRSFGSP